MRLLLQSQSIRQALQRPNNRFSSTASSSTSDNLRNLMRSLAHPVTIITTSREPNKLNHGSTISSFTSLSLHPHPLISFAVKLPSRLSDHLRSSPASPFHVHLLDHSPTSVNLARAFASPTKHALDSNLALNGLDASSLGRLDCEVFKVLELADSSRGEQVGSVLFLGRVIKCFWTTTSSCDNEIDLKGRPLLYHRQMYTTIK